MFEGTDSMFNTWGGGGECECESETTFDKKYIRSSNINNLYIDTNITLCSLYIISRPVSSIYIWRENSRPKSEAKYGARLTQSCKECAEISCFDFDLKNNTVLHILIN